MRNLLRKGQWYVNRHGLRQVWRRMPLLVTTGLVALALVALLALVGSSQEGFPPVHCANKEDTLRAARGVGHWRGGAPSFGDSRETQRRKVLAVVGIQTGFDSVERRKALRATWMPSTPEGISSLEVETNLVFKFVIGHSKDARKMAALEEEIAQYDDFIRIDNEEHYNRLKYKTLAYFKAAFSAYDAKFYVKADDDIYLRPDRLATLLAKARPSDRTYLGCMKKGPVITDEKQKWHEPAGYLLGNEYFLHAYGPIYALSNRVVEDIAASSDSSFRYFANEDVTVGVWMLSMNVDHEDNHALCHQQCKGDSVAVWDIPKCSGLCHPEMQLRELHQMEACGGHSPVSAG